MNKEEKFYKYFKGMDGTEDFMIMTRNKGTDDAWLRLCEKRDGKFKDYSKDVIQLLNKRRNRI